MRRLQDDFHSLAYYQYAIDWSWRAVPLLMDLRLLRFNKTALVEMNVTLPPPHDQGMRRSWTWSDFVGLVCNISRRYGKGLGLRAMSDWDEDGLRFARRLGASWALAPGIIYKRSANVTPMARPER